VVSLALNLHPTAAELASDLEVQQRLEVLGVDAVVSVPDNRAIDVLTHNENEWCGGAGELGFEFWRIEQPSGDVDVFTERSSTVDVHIPGVHRDPQSESSARPVRSMRVELFAQCWNKLVD
jgi:hypothetical protein